MKSHSKHSKYLIWISFAVGALSLYLFLNPIFFKLRRVFVPRRLPDLISARNYYSSLSSFTGYLIGICGLLLGYFYYRSKQRSDSYAADLDRKRKRLDDLIEMIRTVDDLVDDLINSRFDNDKELGRLRSKIQANFDNIETMLDVNLPLLGLEDDEVAAILAINSYVDKNEALMNKKIEEIDKKEFLIYRDEYRSLVKCARKVCYKRVA